LIKTKRLANESLFAVTFEKTYYSVLALAQGLTPDHPILIKSSPGGLGSVFADSILLPDRISYFQNIDLNREIYLHKSLVASAIRGLNLSSKFKVNASLVQRSVEILEHRPRIRLFISAQYPGFSEWSYDLEKRVKSQIVKVESEHLTVRYFEKSLSLWTELLKPKVLLEGATQAPPKNQKRKSKENKKIKKKSTNEIIVVDLEKESKKENPVMHSFEKMETVDDYQGGYRNTDGTDELDEHSDALDDLDLKHVTRGGESAQSILDSDISDFVETPSVEEIQVSSENILLPEWNWRKEQLIPSYCKLLVNDFASATPVQSPNPLLWYEEVLKKQDPSTLQWKERLASLVNQRVWKDRQLDGTDISIDAYVRYLSDVKRSNHGDPRLYVRTTRAAREFSTFVLVDQSLSTDSWVMNRRVLDVELESIALMSYLLRELNEPVAVAGTYSYTRHECTMNIYKQFDSNWDSFLNQASQITPTGYTRLGPSIRHATHLLAERGGRQKLLILLTDGKPTDYDRYEGRYGIEDIHHAHLEAKQKGVQIRALAIEDAAKDYFPHMFGKNEYQIIQDPAKLPEALFKIFLDSIKS